MSRPLVMIAKRSSNRTGGFGLLGMTVLFPGVCCESDAGSYAGMCPSLSHASVELDAGSRCRRGSVPCSLTIQVLPYATLKLGKHGAPPTSVLRQLHRETSC